MPKKPRRRLRKPAEKPNSSNQRQTKKEPAKGSFLMVELLAVAEFPDAVISQDARLSCFAVNIEIFYIIKLVK